MNHSNTKEILSPLKSDGKPLTAEVNKTKGFIQSAIDKVFGDAETKAQQLLAEHEICSEYRRIFLTHEDGIRKFSDFKTLALARVATPEEAADSVLRGMMGRDSASAVHVSDLQNLASRLDNARLGELLIASYERLVLAGNRRQLDDFVAKHSAVLNAHGLI
jgi:hypothetical protein